MDDYQRGVKELNEIGSEKNMLVNQAKVANLIDIQHPEDAILLLTKMVEVDGANLINRLKLAQLFCDACKLDYTHCEEALWELNTIIKADSTLTLAKTLKLDLEEFLTVKPN